MVRAADKLPKINKGDIVILYTNDVHCAAAQVTDGDGVVTNIGYAGVASLKKQADRKAGGGQVTLLDAGDAVQGDAFGTMSQGEYLVDIMNRVGYDLFVPGNHEFDYGMARMLELMDMLDAQMLSTNFMDLQTDAPVFAPYTVLTYGETQVGFVGITTPESFTKSTPVYFQDGEGNYIYGLCEADNGAALYAAVQAAVDAARSEGADYVVAVGHLGVVEASAPWRSYDVIAQTTGIDVLIDGHSHTVLESEWVTNKDGDEVLLTQTGTKLGAVGCLTLSPEGMFSASLIAGYTRQDARVRSFVGHIADALADDLSTVIAVSEVDLVVSDPADGKRMVRNRETNLGDFCADAYRYVLGNGKGGPADIAFVNGGGIRADIPAGEVTFGQVIAVHPFNNAGCVVEATGQEILDALEMAARNLPEESGGFLHVSGLTYTIDISVESPVTVSDKGDFMSADGPRRVTDVAVNGAPIEAERLYTVASHSYMLVDGGDGMSMFRDNKMVVQPVLLDNEVLIRYFEAFLDGKVGAAYTSPYGQGRITIK